MKITGLFLLLWIQTVAVQGQVAGQGQGGRRIRLSPNADGGYFIQMPEVSRFHPGDTIALDPGRVWSYLWIDNYRGRASRPLVILNDGKQVRFEGKHGIEITNSSYIKLTGTGGRVREGKGELGDERYGILLEGDPVLRLADGKGAEIHMRSKCIELDHIAVHNMGFGFVCRTDNFCEDSLTYPNWVLDSINIHDCRLVGIWLEGMYLGNTSPDNAKDSYDPRPIVCNGDTVYPMPMRNGHMRVVHNYVDSTGRGGIQLASASSGMSEIGFNTVRHSGLNGDREQGTGISVGTYSHVYIHDNRVCNTFTYGIASIGGSGTGVPLRIEGNKVDSSGFLSVYDLAVSNRRSINPWTEPVYPDSLSWPYSIQVVSRPTKFTDSTLFRVINNRVGKSKDRHGQIQVSDDYHTMHRSGNRICGNSDLQTGLPAKVYIDPNYPYPTPNCPPIGQ